MNRNHHRAQLTRARAQWVLLALWILCCGARTLAQEPLDALLSRGYVAHWLVCGPFENDVQGGVAGALARHEPPLSNTDFMAPLGKTEQVRPEHKLVVRGGRDGAMWQAAGAEDPTLDLAPFFPQAREGVAYAAFYAEAQQRQAVYFELNTALGARVWMNGALLRDIRAVPLKDAGVDRFVAPFQPGKNLLLFEIPGASFARLAEISGMPVRDLNVHGFSNRPLLRGTSGYEIALRLRPAFPLGDVYYTPQLEGAESFSGAGAQVAQNMALILFNGAAKPSLPIQITLTSFQMNTPLLVEVPSIAPNAEARASIPVPVGAFAVGSKIPVKVRLTAPVPGDTAKTAEFDTQVTVQTHEAGGKVYVVAGRRYLPTQPEDISAEYERQLHSYDQQIKMAEQEPEYGFDLGPMSGWLASLAAWPESRGVLRAAIGMNRCAAEAAFDHPDERIVGGEVLVRNLEYGTAGARERLGDTHGSYYLWNQPGIAPQTPQLVFKAGVTGIVSNLEAPGLPGLFTHEAPDGSSVLHRRKKTAPGPASLEELRYMANTQRKELTEAGFESDLLVNEAQVPPPEPFLFGAARELFKGYPSIRLEGSGAASFFEEVRARGPKVQQGLPLGASLLTRLRLGEVVAQEDLRDAHARVEAQLTEAETLATFAALAGAEYPEEALDAAWRRVLYWSAPQRLAFTENEHVYLDALEGYREAAALSREVRQKAAGYLAAQADTLSGKPGNEKGVQSLVIFNPSPWARTDYCEADITLDNAPGVTLLDDQGNAVPFLGSRIQRANDRFLTALRLRFVAHDIPAWGYRTFYVQPSGVLRTPSVRQDSQIENDYWTVYVDPNTGGIRSIVDKKTGETRTSGLLNHVMALHEDPSKNQSGRGLWTMGQWTDPAAPQSIRTEVCEWMQQITIVSPLGRGFLERTVRLCQGVPRIDCVTRVTNLPLDGKLLTATFEPGLAACAPVHGERFGAVVGRQSQGVLDFRMKGPENASGTGLQPAYRWAALSPNDSLLVGPRTVVPLRPAAIIPGNLPELQEAARAVQRAFWHRGIPAQILPAIPQKKPDLWSDATGYREADEALSEGKVLQVLIGGPDQNPRTGKVLQDIDPAKASEFGKRIEQGAVAYVEHSAGPKEYTPIPALLFAGLLPERSAALAEDFANAVERKGSYTLPPSAYFATTPPETANGGFAVLCQGANLFSREKDGALALVLAHENAALATSKLVDPVRDHEFRYALMPLGDSWRTDNTSKASEMYAHPLFGVPQPLHLGNLRGMERFAAIDGNGLALASVRPANVPAIEGRAKRTHPRDGVQMQVWESTGQSASSGRLEFFPAVRQGSQRGPATPTSAQVESPSESTSSALTVASGALNLPAIAAHAVENFWVLPGTPSGLGAAQELAGNRNASMPSYSAFWKQNTGVSALGSNAISLILRGELPKDTGKLQALVANLRTDQEVQGTVRVVSTEGWSVGPREFYFSLSPGEFKAVDIAVTRTRNAVGGEQAGALAVETDLNGEVFRDVVDEHPEPVTVAAVRSGAQVRVTLKNASGIPAQGFASFITRPRCWSEFDGVPEVSANPYRQPVSVNPFGEQTLLFTLSNPDAAAWGVIKVAANNHVVYTRIPDTGGDTSKTPPIAPPITPEQTQVLKAR